VSRYQPAAVLMGRYRLRTLLVEHDVVSLWEALDLHYDEIVRLTSFEHSPAVLDHGRMDDGVFVVVGAPTEPAPRLELVDVSGEGASYESLLDSEPVEIPMSSPRRLWVWAAVALVCALSVLVSLNAC
jgi:hypothetical protein